MSNSLRDQLLQLGFNAPKPEPQPRDRPPHPRGPSGKHGSDSRGRGKPGTDPRNHGKPVGDRGRPHGKPTQPRPAGGQGKPKSRSEMDLGKAYALRAQQEKDERIAAEREKQEAARLRREARARLVELVKDKGLNDPNAEVVRHFEYGGKIKRIYVTPEQLAALNAGQLGVLQLEGRYVLVDAAMLAQAATIFAQAIALKVDPNAPATDDPYADPKFQVPDDLVW